MVGGAPSSAHGAGDHTAAAVTADGDGNDDDSDDDSEVKVTVTTTVMTHSTYSADSAEMFLDWRDGGALWTCSDSQNAVSK